MEKIKLLTEDIHIWQAFIDDRFNDLMDMNIFCEEEKLRAESFKFDIDRYYYLARHTLLRKILGKYIDPEEIKFKYNDHKKPVLLISPSSPDLNFNLSFSSGHFILAICRGTEIGVDIERVKELDKLDQVARTNFTAREYHQLMELPEELRKQYFFKLWTRKEAVMKGKGEGFYLSPLDFEISFRNMDGIQQVIIPGAKRKDNTWKVSGVHTSENCEAAVATQKTKFKISYFEFLI